MKPSLLRTPSIRRLLPQRPARSHKGQFGHVLIVAGSRGMTGAAYLCALGALKAGAGLVTVAAGESVRKQIASRLPEAMTLPLPESKSGTLTPGAIVKIRAYVRRRTITALAVGPGLSIYPGLKKILRSLLALDRPIILDADGLNALKLRDIQRTTAIITPHAGEFARLAGVSRAVVERSRVSHAMTLAKKAGLICVLKGHHTVVTDGQRVVLNSTGNPAMATGGMGDVLTGVIAALVGQGLTLYKAACVGVFVHGLAGDLAKSSDRGLLASELAMALPRAYRKLGLQ